MQSGVQQGAAMIGHVKGCNNPAADLAPSPGLLH